MTRRPARGMTLIEVVVALAISGIALAAGAAVIGFLTDQQVRATTDTTARSVSIRNALRDWLAGSQLGTAGDIRFTGTRTVDIGGRSLSSLDFVTRAVTPVAAGGDALTRVRLIVNGRSVVAELRALPAGEVMSLPVADSISSLDIRYRSSVASASPWLAAWASTSVLPAVIELRVGSASDPVLSMPMTVLVGERR